MKTAIKNEVVSEGNWTLWLVNETDGSLIREAIVGETYTTKDGAKMLLVSGTPPHKPGSTGRVYVKEINSPFRFNDREFFPNVISMKWVKKD